MNSGLFLFYVALIAIFLVIVTRYTVARLLESRGFGQVGKDSEATTIVSRRQTEAQKLEIENALRQSILEAKEVALQVRSEVEAESRDKRAELQKLEQRLTLREEKLDSLSEQQALRQEEISRKEKLIAETQTEAEAILVERRIALEKASGLTCEEAKKEYLRIVETDSRFEASKIIRQIESEAKRDGDTRARRILTDVIQRCAVEQTSEATVSVVALPSEEMKGRLIGREGRNIRAFETYTGVDLVIDDTPEAVVLSSFDPVRREVARIALTSLILDGRIHPARIEEVVRKSQEEVEAHILEEGERAVIETKITGLAPEITYLLGKMKFRFSYGQNVLRHSIEVSHLCGMLAGEVGGDVVVAQRAGLLHDLGKVVDFEMEGPHALISGQLLRKYNESEPVAHAAEAHHHDVEPSSIEAILVICADQISSSRPGARRETLENYIRRVKRLEQIAESFVGVEKTYAIQAGREIRVIVKPDQIDDIAAAQLAKDMSKRIEEEMEYPGQIKITVIRETRAVDYAR